MDDASLEDLLQRFGFSDKEVDTYLTILALGRRRRVPSPTTRGVEALRLQHRGDARRPRVRRGQRPRRSDDHPGQPARGRRRGAVGRPPGDAAGPGVAVLPDGARSESFEVVKSRVTVLKRVAELVDRAEVEVTLAIPYRLLDEVADELRAAVDRGVLVVLIVTDVDPATELELDGLASVARAWEQPMPTMLTVDQQAGIVAPGEMLSRSDSTAARLSSSPRRSRASHRRLLPGEYLLMAAEVYTADPTGLPPRSRTSATRCWRRRCTSGPTTRSARPRHGPVGQRRPRRRGTGGPGRRGPAGAARTRDQRLPRREHALRRDRRGAPSVSAARAPSSRTSEADAVELLPSE